MSVITSKFVGNLEKAAFAGAITAGLSYFLNGSGSVDLFGQDIPLFLIQGLSVGGGVFITENVKDYIIPMLGIKDLSTVIYVVEPVLTGLSSSLLMGILTGGFEMDNFVKDTLIGAGSTVGGHYLQGAIMPSAGFKV